MEEFLINLSTQHLIWVYFLIVIIAIIEGPVLSIILGALIKLGYFSFWPTYIVLMLGDLIGDVFWYGLGYFSGPRFVEKYGKYVSITPERIEKVKDIFHTYHLPILFTSKITNGLGFALAFLFTAGMVRIPFKSYFTINVIGQFVWTILLIGFGYFFSELYLTFDTILSRLFITALLIAIVAAFVGFSHYLKNRVVTK